LPKSFFPGTLPLYSTPVDGSIVLMDFWEKTKMFGVIAYIAILFGAFTVAVLLLFGLRAVKLI